MTGTFIGEKSLWGQGYGTDAARVRIHYAFEVVGLRMLLSGTLQGNERSYKMLTNAGYKEYGRVPKQYWKRGAYRDYILMAISKE